MVMKIGFIKPSLLRCKFSLPLVSQLVDAEPPAKWCGRGGTRQDRLGTHRHLRDLIAITWGKNVDSWGVVFERANV